MAYFKIKLRLIKRLKKQGRFIFYVDTYIAHVIKRLCLNFKDFELSLNFDISINTSSKPNMVHPYVYIFNHLRIKRDKTSFRIRLQFCSAKKGVKKYSNKWQYQGWYPVISLIWYNIVNMILQDFVNMTHKQNLPNSIQVIPMDQISTCQKGTLENISILHISKMIFQKIPK